MTITINYVAVLVAAIAAFVLGFLWHGPLFGKQWLKLSGITPEQMKEAQAQNMTPRMVAAFVAQIVMAFVLAQFVALWNATDIAATVQLAFWVWLGFIVTVLLNGVLWERRTVSLYLFNIVYHLASLFVMTLILALWQ